MNKTVLFYFFTLIFVFLFQSPILAQNNLPSLLLEPNQIESTVNNTFTVDLLIDTANQDVAGVGAELFYNQNQIEVTKIDTYPVFDSYPNASFDNKQGTLSISGINDPTNNSLFNGKERFATITFRSKKVGQVTVKFNYLPNNTRDSNIAVTYGNGDILAYTNSLNVSISPNTITSSIAISPTPIPDTTPTNNYLIIIGSIIGAIIIFIIVLSLLFRNKNQPSTEPTITIRDRNQPILKPNDPTNFPSSQSPPSIY